MQVSNASPCSQTLIKQILNENPKQKPFRIDWSFIFFTVCVPFMNFPCYVDTQHEMRGHFSKMRDPLEHITFLKVFSPRHKASRIKYCIKRFDSMSIHQETTISNVVKQLKFVKLVKYSTISCSTTANGYCYSQ